MKRQRAGSSGLKAEQLLRSVRQRRHRAALLRAAASWLLGNFTTAMGDKRPKLFIQERTGAVEPADLDVVATLVCELEEQAQGEREAIQRLLGLDLKHIEPRNVPVIEGSEPMLQIDVESAPLPSKEPESA